VVFNSTDFVIFFAAFCAVYFLVPFSFRWIILALASTVFYGWAKPVYLLLLSASVLISWIGANKIYKTVNPKDRKRAMILTVSLSVLILIAFKYLGFFNEIISVFSKPGGFRLPELLLPLGISFFTFQSLSYVLDVHFKVRKPEPHLGYFFVFVSFFPQILSGPISRANELLPQLQDPKKHLWSDVERGIIRFCWGLFKKLVVADRIGIIVDGAYANPEHYAGSVHWFVTILYAIQLYADFSGYTDMAIGLARIIGIRLPENFDFPYISKNITEFWRRWHLSLSNWLRDYLYTPIMFSKKKWGKWAVVYAIFITFLICGLWHGAKLTFVIFGILQGAALTWELLSKDLRAKIQKSSPPVLYNTLSWLVTFLFVCFCFVFFRADTTADSLLIAKRMFISFYDVNAVIQYLGKDGTTARYLFSLAVALIFLATDKQITGKLITIESPGWKSIAWTGTMIALIVILGVLGRTDFIYFKF
jgi:alginate O-acetyltransferase complex protein AlgI